MSATNIIKTVKRHFGVLDGVAISFPIGILILYACDNEKVLSGIKDCAEKPSCEDYTRFSKRNCKNAYLVFRVP